MAPQRENRVGEKIKGWTTFGETAGGNPGVHIHTSRAQHLRCSPRFRLSAKTQSLIRRRSPRRVQRWRLLQRRRLGTRRRAPASSHFSLEKGSDATGSHAGHSIGEMRQHRGGFSARSPARGGGTANREVRKTNLNLARCTSAERYEEMRCFRCSEKNYVFATKHDDGANGAKVSSVPIHPRAR